jgi:hypothetical protein
MSHPVLSTIPASGYLSLLDQEVLPPDFLEISPPYKISSSNNRKKIHRRPSNASYMGEVA